MVTFQDSNGDDDRIQAPDQNGEYSCPVCGEYTGERGSVEAHITGKSDQAHKGMVGKDYRVETPDGEVHLRRKDAPPLVGTTQMKEMLNDSAAGDVPDDDPEPEPEDSDDDLAFKALVTFGFIYVLVRLLGRDSVQNGIQQYGEP